MGTGGRSYFHERVLRGGVSKECFWENFDDAEKKRIYQVTGYVPCEIKEGERLKFAILYLDKREQGSKTPEEAAYDLDAWPIDLIDLGKYLGSARVVSPRSKLEKHPSA